MILISVLCLPSCYLSRQALHYNHLINSRRHIAYLLQDQDLPEKTRHQLRLIQDLVRYATESQGLNGEGSYRYYVESKGDAVSYLITAAYPDRLESRNWWFPFVGTVPYLGFFSEADRDAEGRLLAEEGYDVWAVNSAAFSGLGWIDDPVFSVMLKGDDRDLASVIFHELVHRSFWLKGHPLFNENLASYLEEWITVQYLADSGLAEAELAAYQLAREERAEDQRLYQQWLRDLTKALNGLYGKAAAGAVGRSALFAEKDKIFRDFRASMRPAFRRVDYVGKEPWNNARVLASSLYSPDTERFARAHRCAGLLSAGAFLEKLQEQLDREADPFVALDRLCSPERTLSVQVKRG